MQPCCGGADASGRPALRINVSYPAGRPAANPLHAAATRSIDGTDRRTDGRTPDCYIDLSTLKGKGSPYSITERRVPELIPVFGSQPAGDVSHKPGCRLSLLSARPAVALATIKRAATNFAAW